MGRLHLASPTKSQYCFAVIVVHMILLATAGMCMVPVHAETDVVAVSMGVTVRYPRSVESFLFKGAGGEMTVRLPITQIYFSVVMTNKLADCLECYVNYTIMEGKELMGNPYTSTSFANIGPVGCVPKGEYGYWALFFTPLSTGNITLIISYEGRYQEWGGDKIVTPPKQEVTISVLPAQQTELGEVLIYSAAFAVAISVGAVSMLRRSRSRASLRPDTGASPP